MISKNIEILSSCQRSIEILLNNGSAVTATKYQHFSITQPNYGMGEGGILLAGHIQGGQWRMNQLQVYEAPNHIPGREDYQVKVRTAGGEWQPLFVYEVKVDIHEVRPASMLFWIWRAKQRWKSSVSIRRLKCEYFPRLTLSRFRS
ncbi:hypothetical protein AMQ84_24605 [Paenibacillus riograndensis]|uniref:Uncharacterized protein n=1 Tax=Paenibacillus riograndensis TaxID=483937 RepID=A0A132TM61_9BACL|nr:hypothetical protein AMQ84_24605 [Paenibacillus riograndensis]KWX85134.1 hypothetical protein AMQ83_26585 [Paenibacillus riograndensis]